MVASQNGILAVGGWDGSNRGEILKLDCMEPSCQWVPMANSLKIPRDGHTLIPLPRSGGINVSGIICKCDKIGTASCTKSQTGDSCNCHPGYDGNKCQKCSADYNFFPFPNCGSQPSK